MQDRERNQTCILTVALDGPWTSHVPNPCLLADAVASEKAVRALCILVYVDLSGTKQMDYKVNNVSLIKCVHNEDDTHIVFAINYRYIYIYIYRFIQVNRQMTIIAYNF